MVYAISKSLPVREAKAEV